MARPNEMLPTYEVRLARHEAGQGPRATGLSEFVEALRHTDGPVGVFLVEDASAHYTGLLDQTGATLLALVRTIHADI